MLKDQEVKQGLSLFGAGDLFNEAVAVQLFQAEKQKAIDLKDAKHFQNQLPTSSEAWETASVKYLGFQYQKVEVT